MRILAIFPCEYEDWQILGQLQADCLALVFVLPEVDVPLNQISSGKIRRVARAELSPAAREELGKSPPDLVLWFGRLWSIQAWKFWRELVRLAPEALLTVVLSKERAQCRLFEDAMLRIGLWFRLVDYVLFSSGKSCMLSKLNPQRCAVLQSSGDETLTALLQKRLLAHQKSVLWVDPNLTARSPSMRSLVNSIHALSGAGWSVRGLCYEHQEDDPLLETTRLPRLPLPRTLDLLQFFFSCNLYRFIQIGLFRRRPAMIVHTTCSYDFQADLVSIHFCQHRWLEFSFSLGVRSVRDQVGLQLCILFCTSILHLRLGIHAGRVCYCAFRTIGIACDNW